MDPFKLKTLAAVRATSPEDRLPPKQLALPFHPREIDLDGVPDAKADGIRYLGKAMLVFDDVYQVLADVCGSLCVVEVSVQWLSDSKKT